MPVWLQLAIAALSGGGATAAVEIAGRWLRSRVGRHASDRTVDADLQKHWTDTTLELVDALRTELHDARSELATLRAMPAKLAHLEEALDHIHALLAAIKSDNSAELRAAERRAQAFLRKMRGDQLVAPRPKPRRR